MVKRPDVRTASARAAGPVRDPANHRLHAVMGSGHGVLMPLISGFNQPRLESGICANKLAKMLQEEHECRSCSKWETCHIVVHIVLSM